MAEARKSYMTKEQLEQYLADLRNNRPQRPTGSRPISVTAKTRWSLLRSSTSASAPPPSSEPIVVDLAEPPSLHSATPPPALTRRESRLIRKHSSPTHKRSSTTSSILGFVRSPSRAATEDDKGWDGVDRQDGRTNDATSPSRTSTLKQKRESAPAGSFRGFSYTSRVHGRTQSISSSSSSSSGNSERKKRVSWKLPASLSAVSEWAFARTSEGWPGEGIDFPQPGTQWTQRVWCAIPPETRIRRALEARTNSEQSPKETLAKVEGLNGLGGQTPPEETTPVRKNNTKYGAQYATMSAPRITVSKTNTAPTIPTISFPDDNDNQPKPPTIRISGSTPAIPTINVSDKGSSTKTPPVPTISIGDAPTRISTRPLPQPRSGPSSVYSSASTRARTATATCNLCRNPIQGRIVSAGSLRFHPDCFRCDHCQTALEHVGFYPEPKEHRSKRLEKAGIVEDHSNGTGIRFYCHLDFHELFSPRCKSCKTPIEGEVVVACGSTWHQGHFYCAECGDPFDQSSKFVEKDGYAWCVGCYTKRYSGRCKKCKKPVTETVVKALGGEWHEECFCCTECGCTFDDGRFFVRGTDGREVPVCVACEERRLKA
ncbi:hypothetical protein BDD12DRAFT_841680 [Trichophaea hybrida]|nr:hypothetical protein BDD12DRAFT_841680 [Trichophaea hybrida]